MPIDLSSEHRKIVEGILKKYIPNHYVVVFGSRVTGTANKTSDLDLCIMGDEHISFAMLSNLRDEFSLSDLPYKVDLIDWTTVTSDFKTIITTNAVEIQGNRNTR
jgi:predicted nucleotidyltransferase